MNWRKLKHFCHGPPQYGLNLGAEEYLDDGLRLLRTTDIREDGSLSPIAEPVFVSPEAVGERHVLREGDLLFSRAGSLGRCFRVPNGSQRMTFAGYLVRFRPRQGVDPRFIEYCAASLSFKAAITADAVTSTISNFNAERYANIRLPDVAPSEQKTIADFLDTETARIDALITKKRRSIELIEERFSAYIRTQLAQTGPVLPLKRRWTVVDCKHRTPDYVDHGYPVVSPGDVTPGRLNLDRAHRFVDEADFSDLADTLRRPQRGDIIYSRNASIGIAAFVDTDYQFCMGQDVCRVTSADQDQLYLTYVLNSVGLDQLDVQKIGSTFSRVNVAQILQLEIPTPDVVTQKRLAADFDRRRLVLDEVVDHLDRQMALLQEHRQALVTADVTGELELPGVAA